MSRERSSSARALVLWVGLGLVLHVVLWTGWGLGRERLPSLGSAHDLAWLPAAGWTAFWIGAAALVGATVVAGRGRADRFDGGSLLAVLLASAAGATAWRGARYTRQIEEDHYTFVFHYTSVFHLAFLLGAAAVIAGLFSVVRVARSGGRLRGAVLAGCAVLIPPGHLWWVYYFLVAPEYAQVRPGADQVELPVVPDAFLYYGTGRELPALELRFEAGEAHIRPYAVDARDQDWREFLAETVRAMPKGPSGVESEPEPVPDGALALRIDARVTAADVQVVLDACRGLRLWNLRFVTRLGVGSIEGLLHSVLWVGSGPRAPGPELELHVTSGPEGRELWFRYGTADSVELAAVLQSLNGFEGVLQVRADPTARWDEVARVVGELCSRGLVSELVVRGED